MITIVIGDDHTFTADNNILGVEGENNSEILDITVPEKYQNYDKYIEFVLPYGKTYTSLPLANGQSHFTWAVPNSVMKAGNVSVNVKIADSSGIVFKSFSHVFQVYESANATAIIPDQPVELVQIDTENIKDNSITDVKIGARVINTISKTLTDWLQWIVDTLSSKLDITATAADSAKLGGSAKANFTRPYTYVIAATDTPNNEGADLIIDTGAYFEGIINDFINSPSFIPNSTVIIRNGSYLIQGWEIDINKSCKIISEGEFNDALISEKNATFIINADNVTLEGVCASGIGVYGNNCKILNCTVDICEINGSNGYFFGNRKYATSGGGMTEYVNLGTNNIIETAADSAKLGGKLPSEFVAATEKAAPNGVATLDSNSRLAQQEFSIYTEKLVTATPSAGTLTLDLSQGRIFKTTTAESDTLVFTNVPSGTIMTSVTLFLTYNTGSSITFPASVKWNNNYVPTFTAGKTYKIIFQTLDGGVTWYTSVGGAF